MITEKDLQEAIAECEGARNPNANTCIKLAAYYTIQRELYGEQEQAVSLPHPIRETIVAAPYESDTEFGRIVGRLNTHDVLEAMDELVSTVQVLNPPLYDAVIRKLNQL